MLKSGLRGCRLIALAVLLFGIALPAGAQTVPPLQPVATIALPNTSGRIDHLSIDLKRQRLFVAELGNGTVDVIDLTNNSVLYRIAGLRDPQGVLYVPQADRLAVSSGGDGSVRFYDGNDYVPRGVVALGDEADNLRLEPRHGLVIAGFGSGGLAIIDPVKPALVKTVKLPAHPEGFQIAAVTQRAFVNVPNAHQIDIVDLATGRLTARWPAPHLSGNFPLALGEPNIVASVFRSPARLVRFAIDKAMPVSANDTCGDADDVFFDTKRQRYYVSCGAGSVDTFQLTADNVQPLQKTMTASGARTSLFVPEMDRLFVAVHAGPTGANASIRVFRPSP